MPPRGAVKTARRLGERGLDSESGGRPVDVRPLSIAGGVGGLGHARGHVLARLSIRGRCRGSGEQALDVDLTDKAGANLPRSPLNRLDRRALDLAHGRR
jgi:hypothetical protein